MSVEDTNREMSIEDTETESSLKSEFDNDLFLRIKGDKNLQTGVKKFVNCYRSLLCGPAPSAALATAFHYFGRNYSKEYFLLYLYPNRCPMGFKEAYSSEKTKPRRPERK